MKILSRYIARTYLRFWVITLLALVLLVVLSNVLGNLDSVFSSRERFEALVDETIRSMPTVLDLAIPMTVLLATLFTFNSLGRSSELVAMKSVGMGMFRQLRPIFFVVIFIAALDYVNQNYLYRMLQGAELTTTAPSDAHRWSILRDQIIYARRTDPERGRVYDARIFQWADAPFRLERLERVRRVDRRGAGTWRMRDVLTRHLAAGGWALEHQARLIRPRSDFPDLFQHDALDAHHMPLFELSAKIRQLETQGRRVELYDLEWYQKTAALFAPFALVWFGAPLAQAYFRRGRASGEIMFGILGGLLFLIATEILFTLGKGGYLAPFIAAWAVNGVFIVLGCALLWRVR